MIVIDGTDGSGKATQVALLEMKLKKDGRTVKIVDFPEYYKNFFGEFIGHCLSEQYYNFVKVHPKIASVLYAADRFESKGELESWLSLGYVVLANRYVSANQIHQGGKISNPSKRAAYMKWLEKMEYEVFKIPRPDVVLYLDVPIELTSKMMKERNKNDKGRAYLGKKKDVHENDQNFLENSRKSALWLTKHDRNFIKIECAKKGTMLSRDEIHGMIYENVKNILK